jgi:hypothetical protein
MGSVHGAWFRAAGVVVLIHDVRVCLFPILY